jgi:ATP-dependent protease ClpP protease subunit
MDFTENSEFEGTLDGVISSVYDWWSGEVITEPALKSMKAFLDKSAGKAVKINVSSMGGEIDSALVLADAIKAHGRVTMRARGLVASSGTILLASANKVEIDEYSQLMIHQAKGGNFGTAKEVQETADLIAKYTDTIIQMYVDTISRNGKLIDGDIEKTRQKMKDMVYSKDYYLSAKEALDLGLVNKITGNGQIAKEAKNTMSARAQKAEWIQQTIALKQKGVPMAILNSAGTSLGFDAAESKTILDKFKGAVSNLLGYFVSTEEQPEAVEAQAETKDAPVQVENNQSINQSKTEMEKGTFENSPEIQAFISQQVATALAAAKQEEAVKAQKEAEQTEGARLKAELEAAKAENLKLKEQQALGAKTTESPLDLATKQAAHNQQQNKQQKSNLTGHARAAEILASQYPEAAKEMLKAIAKNS